MKLQVLMLVVPLLVTSFTTSSVQAQTDPCYQIRNVRRLANQQYLDDRTLATLENRYCTGASEQSTQPTYNSQDNNQLSGIGGIFQGILGGSNNNDRSRDDREAVRRIYREVLEREADRSGLNTYTKDLANGWTLSQVREDLAHSQEARNAINRVYQEVLGRNADSGGLYTYANKLADGWSLNRVRQDIARSPEARGRNSR